MNADNSLSATRESNGVAPVKVVKLKKPQQIKVNPQRESLQTLAVGVPASQHSQSIGKRRPLIIRKNNYITGNGGSNERGSHKDMTDTSPLNKTSNFQTLMNGSSNVRLNNTNSFVGISSEVSLSQTHTTGNIKNNTAGGTGISHILKTLNSTVPGEDSLNAAQFPNNKMSLQQLTLKDAKLIRNNMSKKRLDTARKSRLHQIHAHDPSGAEPSTGIYNSLSQQPESR